MKKCFSLYIFFVGVMGILISITPHTVYTAVSLNDYWNGEADWKYVTKWTESSLGNDTLLDGIHIEVVGSNWYLFTRKTFLGNRWGTEVRRSTNKGLDWGSPVTIIEPEDGTPWESIATDGQPFFDGSRWHYVFQCKNAPANEGVWKGCYAYRDNPDPRGEWKKTTYPIITPNSLWGPICDSGSDDCYKQVSGRRVHDEGTFGTFLEDGLLWISFHGWAGPCDKTFRGLVSVPEANITTPAPSTWNVGANGAPTDAILDYKDGKSWREHWGSNLVGPGHGSILYDEGYYYILPEMVNNDLGGGGQESYLIEGQKWDVGLLRIYENDLSSSTKWDQLSDRTGEYQNPVLYSSMPPLRYSQNGSQLLTLQYPRLFKDTATGEIYMIVARNYCNYPEEGKDTVGICTDGHKNRDVSAIYLYRLEHSGHNALKNADLWIPGPFDRYWKQHEGANLVIYRRFWLASDGNQFMQFNKGANNLAGASIYQDVEASGYRGRRFTFGGKFRMAEAGQQGALRVSVHQLDGSGDVIASDDLPIGADAVYRPAERRSSDVILDNAATLRFELYPLTPDVNFRADELFLNIDSSAAAKQPGSPSTTLEWEMMSSEIGHVVGRADGSDWSADGAQDGPGFLQFGPYTTALGAGQHTAFWTLATQSVQGSASLVQLQVYDYDDRQVLAWRNLKPGDWSAPSALQTFEVPFFLSGSRAGHRMEFRVWWFDRAAVREQGVGVRTFSAPPDPNPDPTLSCVDMNPIGWDMFSPDIGHVIGRADSGGWAAHPQHDPAGFLQFGPYVETLSSGGTYTVSWNLLTDYNLVGDDVVARLEVVDYDDNGYLLASKDIRRNAWQSPFTYQNFDLSFMLDAGRHGHRLEFRIWWNDRAYIRVQHVGVRCSTTPPPPTPTPPPIPTPTPPPAESIWYMDSPYIGHLIGRADSGGWSANVQDDNVGFLQFGPYTTVSSPGWYTATWSLMIDNTTFDNSPIVRLEVIDADDNFHQIAATEVTRHAWNTPFVYQDFALNFSLDAFRVGHKLEFRVWWYDRAYIREQSVKLRR